MHIYMDSIGKRKIYTLLVIEVIVVYCVHILNIKDLYAFFLSEDELGYWGNAAFFLGKDWGNAVNYCSYYSYGYSLFLMLIMCLPISSLKMYHLAIIANSLFMVVSLLISYYLFIHLFPEKNKYCISIVCMAMTLYSSYVSQSSVAWSECYLVLFFWMTLLQAYFVCTKMTNIGIVLFSIELVYLYMIHQRTLPFIIAGILMVTLLTVNKRNSIKQLVIMILVIFCMGYISLILKNGLKMSLYGVMRDGNDYASIINGMNFYNMFIPVIREMAGQIFYLWASSFGIIPLGIGITYVLCKRKWKEREPICFFYIFVIVSFIGLLMVSSIFMREAVKRVDYLIYGRYVEIAVGFFIIIGFIHLSNFIKQKKSSVIFLITSIAFVILACLLIDKIKSWGISLDTHYQGVCAPGVYWFYSLRGFHIMELCLVILVIEAIIFVINRTFVVKGSVFVVNVIIICFFWVKVGNTVVEQQIIPYQTENNKELVMKVKLWDYIKEHNEYIVFLTNTLYNIRGSIQFYMQEVPLICVQDLKELNYAPEILIIDNDDSMIDKNAFEGYHFVCMIGKKSMYSLNAISFDDSQGEISKNQFGYNKIGTDEAGCVMYGPYIRLEPGFYEVIFQMNSSINGQHELGQIEVTSNCGENIICSTIWDGTSETVSMNFQLLERTTDIEFRYQKYEGNDTSPIRVILNEAKSL